VITRLQVDGFKNLVDVDIHFGKFNVVTGPNGIGKSNLFDAIQFLNRTAWLTLAESVKRVRGAEGDPKKLIFHHGKSGNDVVSFYVTFSQNEGQNARYEIHLSPPSNNRFMIERESLESDSVIYQTVGNILEIGEKKLQTYPNEYSVMFAMYRVQPELPWFEVAKDEILSWKIINYIPDQIRSDDTLSDEPVLGVYGEHLPLVLERIERNSSEGESPLTRLSQRLFSLTGEIKEVRVQRFEPAERVWIEVRDPDGTWHNARALSDGTLRFLALAVLWLDPKATGVFCIEEPENGIHPSKFPALMRLLRDIAEKPGCQVIVNTHSPLLVAQAPDEDIIVVTRVSAMDDNGNSFVKPKFCCLKGTWRDRDGKMPTVPVSALSAFLDIAPERERNEFQRFVDRPDTQRLLHKLWEVEGE